MPEATERAGADEAGSSIAGAAGSGAVEQAICDFFGHLDRAVHRLVERRGWTLWVGGLAIILSLCAHAPSSALIAPLRTSWLFDVLRAQVAHPLTQLDLTPFEPAAAAAHQIAGLQHMDKLAFRLTVPLLGHVLHTGGASFLLASWIAGLFFFPMLARVAGTLFGDRTNAAYVTFAFALSESGKHIFNDEMFGDGLAWLLLLMAVRFRNAGMIFASVLLAGFTDERALAGSGAVLLYWLAVEASPAGKPTRDGWLRAAVVIAAWLAYFAVRLALGHVFGLRTGWSGLLDLDVVRRNLWFSYPWGLLQVFQGLWLWIVVAAITLYLRRRFLFGLAFGGVAGAIVAAATLVWDFTRSVGYALILLPVAWRTQALTPASTRALARSTFLVGFCFVVPYDCVFSYLYHLGRLLR